MGKTVRIPTIGIVGVGMSIDLVIVVMDSERNLLEALPPIDQRAPHHRRRLEGLQHELTDGSPIEGDEGERKGKAPSLGEGCDVRSVLNNSPTYVIN